MTNYRTWNQWPIMAEDVGLEGAFPRFRSFPNVQDLRAVALFGFKTYANPAVLEEITDDLLVNAITSAVTEIEMTTGMSLTPTEFSEVQDMSEGSSDVFNPYNGYRLKAWPVTQVLSISYAYPHATTDQTQLSYEIPPNWVSLRRGRISIVPGQGVPTILNGNGSASATFVTGPFNTSVYRPSAVKIRYLAGFDECRVPSVLVDAILTLATIRLLTDIAPMLFPFNSVSNSLDSVSQSASTPIYQYLQTRLQMLEKKYTQQINAVKGAMGRLIKISFVSSGG